MNETKQKKEQILGLASALAAVVNNTIGDTLTDADVEELAKFFLIDVKLYKPRK